MLLAVWAEWRSCPLGCLCLPSLMCLTFHSNSRMAEHHTGAQPPILHILFATLIAPYVQCVSGFYYLPVCLFIHLFIPWHHQTLSACPAVSTAHLISSWLNSSLSICSYKLFDFYYFILSLSSFQSSYLTHCGFSIGQYNYCKWNCTECSDI